MVLIVDDDGDLCRDLAELMERRGFRVATAHNGREALAQIADLGPPCLIVLDLAMPEMDGRALRAELLKHPQWAGIPVVVVSGMLDTSDDLDSLQAVEHLRKPIDLQRLYRVVAEHCAG